MVSKKCILCGGTKSVFCLPSDPATRQKWFEFIKKNLLRDETFMRPSRGVCYKHFLPRDFGNLIIWNYARERGQRTNLRIFKHAVPSVLEPKTLSHLTPTKKIPAAPVNVDAQTQTESSLECECKKRKRYLAMLDEPVTFMAKKRRLSSLASRVAIKNITKDEMSPITDHEYAATDLNMETSQEITSYMTISQGKVPQEGTSQKNSIKGESIKAEPPQSNPLIGEPSNGSPSQGSLLEEKPSQESLLEGKPLQGSLLEGKPLQGSLLEGKPTQGELSQIKPIKGESSQIEPIAGSSKPMDTSIDSDGEDAEYRPESTESESDDEEMKDEAPDPYCPLEGSSNKDVKFVVSWARLAPLLKRCPFCLGIDVALRTNVCGVALVVTRECLDCRKASKWFSSGRSGNTIEENLLMASAIVFSGALPSKCLRMFKFLGLKVISASAFHKYQRNYLHKTVEEYWENQRIQAVAKSKENGSVICSGDARFDSSRYSAMFGSYSLYNVDLGLILSNKMVQVNEVGNSQAMELEGLKRCLDELKESDCLPSKIITDPHVQISKYLRTTYGEQSEADNDEKRIEHLYDPWHVVKNLKKDLKKAAKKDSSGLINRWISPVIRHIYWCLSSTPDGNKDVIEAKYLSITNHVIDVHKHKNPHYPKCMHEDTNEQFYGGKYFTDGTDEYKCFCTVICKQRRIAEIRRLSTVGQTSSLESFHSLCNVFASKNYSFSYHAMRTRLLLAAIHHNTNAESRMKSKRALAIHYQKKNSFKPSFFMKKNHSPNYDYVHQLIEKVLEKAKSKRKAQLPKAPPPLCSPHKLTKDEEKKFLKEFKSRFSTSQDHRGTDSKQSYPEAGPDTSKNNVSMVL